MQQARLHHRGLSQICSQPPCKRFATHIACQSFNTRRQTVLQLSAPKTASDMESLPNPSQLLSAPTRDISVTKRCVLAMAAMLSLQLASSRKASADEAPAAPALGDLTDFVNPQQGYSLRIPGTWDKKEKAGADVLFENPEKKSTNVGITVTPVRVNTIQKFGTVESVGEKLLGAEKAKESTLDVQLLSSGSRTGAAGALLYFYEYELDSTRGRKRVLDAVSIYSSKLYILSATAKCGKEACTAEDQATVDLLRRISDSFDVAPPS